MPILPTHRTDAAGLETLSADAIAIRPLDFGLLLALVAHHPGGTEVATLHPGVPVVLGRRVARGLRVAHTTLSREHARFERVGRLVVVADLGSKNGVVLAGQRVQRAELDVGDEVMCGAVRVRVQALGLDGQPAGSDAAPLRRNGEPEVARDDGVVGGYMRALLDDARGVAASRIPVVLRGETGAGKEVLARLIHERGPRGARRMVRVNCGAIPRELIESTLFGHERGAFTGALQQHRGVFEEADGGTVFLDEIGELPPAAQVALLRVLEVGSFSRVGAVRELAVDVRVIAATHRDLEAMSRSGGFRADLYYRLAGVTIEIAPLRARADDIEPLALRFLAMANAANGRSIEGIATDALVALRAYDWPGNVRELRNAIERAVVVARGARIDIGDLPGRVRGVEPAATREHDAPGMVRAKVRDYEASKLREALEAAAWNRSAAAQRLAIPVRTLSYRMKLLGLKKPGA